MQAAAIGHSGGGAAGQNRRVSRAFLALLYRILVGQAFLPALQRTGLEACPYLCRTRYTNRRNPISRPGRQDCGSIPNLQMRCYGMAKKRRSFGAGRVGRQPAREIRGVLPVQGVI